MTNYRPIVWLYTGICYFWFHVPWYLIITTDYLKGRWTSTNSLTFTDYFHNSFINSQQTLKVYLDFSKALVINHSLLNSAKLVYKAIFITWLSFTWTIGIKVAALEMSFNLFALFHQCVLQGSNLGLILFAIFINDITQCIYFVKFLIDAIIYLYLVTVK